MAKRKKDKTSEPTIENRKARHDYEISDTLECGIVLFGSEVKSIRDGRVSLGEGYVRVQEDPPELWLHSVNVDEYAPASHQQHKMGRAKKLLAHKREILKIYRQVQAKGMSVVPLRMYFKDGRVKVLIGVGLGRKQFDKRQAIQNREMKREMDRAMSKRM